MQAVELSCLPLFKWQQNSQRFQQNNPVFIWPAHSNTMKNLDKQFLLYLYFKTHLILLTQGEKRLFSLQGKDLAKPCGNREVFLKLHPQGSHPGQCSPGGQGCSKLTPMYGLGQTAPADPPHRCKPLSSKTHFYSPLSVMPSFLNSILCQLTLAFETTIFAPSLEWVRGAASERQRRYKISATLGRFIKLGGGPYCSRTDMVTEHKSSGFPHSTNNPNTTVIYSLKVK